MLFSEEQKKRFIDRESWQYANNKTNAFTHESWMLTTSTELENVAARLCNKNFLSANYTNYKW